MSDEETELRAWLVAGVEQLDEAVIERTLASLSAGERMSLGECWPVWAHGGQQEPPGDWRVWVIQAGRGFGKTRAGAEWVWARARENGDAQIALVGATLGEVVDVMVHGESGLIASAREDEAPHWVASRRMLVFPSGARAFAYSGEKPDKLRGPQHHYAWCDELAKWAKPDSTWDNLMLGLRLGTRPRAVVTTTPRPIPLLKRIEATERTAVTRGRTVENRHLCEDFKAAVTGMYAGTRLGRQELDGELIEDFEGALWSRALLEQCRVPLILPSISRGGGPLEERWRGPFHHAAHGPPPPEIRGRTELVRVVVGVDPPASAAGDACGIVVCGVDSAGIGWVLADCSAAGLSPQGWAAKVAAAAAAWEADRVVAEGNNGGEMVEAVLRAADSALRVKRVHASEGKGARAAPVATLFEGGKVKLAGAFPALEDQLCGMLIGGRYEGPGRSPDRADACVWALTELMLKKKRGEPRIVRF